MQRGMDPRRDASSCKAITYLLDKNIRSHRRQRPCIIRSGTSVRRRRSACRDEKRECIHTASLGCLSSCSRRPCGAPGAGSRARVPRCQASSSGRVLPQARCPSRGCGLELRAEHRCPTRCLCCPAARAAGVGGGGQRGPCTARRVRNQRLSSE